VNVPTAVQEPLDAPRLRVEDLTIASTRGVEILQDVSLDVIAGEVLGLVGESGSGKTTLALAMIGYARRGLRFAGGSVRLDGRDLLTLHEPELRRLRGATLAYVPQDPATALNPSRRVGSQLRESLTFHDHHGDEVEERIAELLDEVGLAAVPGVLDVFPHQLSGGQQQRVTIAMAFACRPAVIVLDEPTTGLDVTTQRTVLSTVAQLCSRYDVAAVYVSHDVAVVGELASRVAVLYAGRVVEVGRVPDVFGAPGHPYSQGLLRAVPSPDRAERLHGMEGIPPRPGARPTGCAFAPRCPLAVDICRTGVPDLRAAHGPGHLARCVFATPDLVAVSGPSPGAGPEVEARTPVAGPAAEEPVLAIADLNASFGSTHVLHGVSLEVRRGECVAVVGESGSGKTTLARCIVGLHANWSGDIAFEGAALPHGLRHRSLDQLRRLQYVFQNPYASLNPRRSIGGLVAQPVDHFTRLDRRESDRAVRDAIASVSLPVDLVSRYPDQLSGGERQRVAISRTIAVGPSLLVCDEVTSALDVSVQASVVEMLRRLQAERSLSLLFITHNLALVRSVAQHVVVMKEGRIVEAGPVAAVLDHPQDAYTRALMSDVPRFDARTGR
jgi:peptide/nickel transport system ATP-binding protein